MNTDNSLFDKRTKGIYTPNLVYGLIMADNGEENQYERKNICSVYGNSGLNGDSEADREIRKANATFICTACNSYDKLVEINKELLKALKGLYNSVDAQLLQYKFGAEIGKAKAAIDKATKL
jgi:hypothetical protein